jgi:tetratricopeptide (TPR) repeat protein
MRASVGAGLLSMFVWVASVRAEDCVLGQRYLALAHDRIASFANDEAITFLRQSADVCPTYDTYEQLGEFAAQSPQRDDKVAAVGAFVAAHALAPSAQARAQSLYQYAALLNREGDPQNAYALIKDAHSLDPSRADITSLVGTVETQVQHPTQEHIVRALNFSLYQPLTASVVKESGGGTGASTMGANSSGASGTVPAARERVAVATGPSVNIPINFNTASIEVDSQTRPNLDLLAHALADPALAGKVRPRKTLGLQQLRRYAIARSLFKATSLPRAIARLGFVQADPMRAPARAQDLILAQRVKGYRAGELERRYPRLAIEEAFFFNYGFLPRQTLALLHPRGRRAAWDARMQARAQEVLAFVRQHGPTHPRDVQAHFDHGRIKRWGAT